MLKLTKQTIKDYKEIKVKKIKSLISSIMLTKLRLRQKNGFLIKERVSSIYIYYTEAYLEPCQTLSLFAKKS